jgi:hypothetical protein
MEKLLKEYHGWLSDNNELYTKLKNHDSALYHRFQPVYEVLYRLYQEYKNKKDEANEDIEKIFQVGLEYLNMQFFTCKIYLNKTFNKDFHEFLIYDKVINYSLFLEDLEYELAEKQIDYDKDNLLKLSEHLSDIIENKKDIPDNLNLYIDSQVHKIINLDNYSFNGIIDIFVEIADALGINYDEETDFIIGKDF